MNKNIGFQLKGLCVITLVFFSFLTHAQPASAPFDNIPEDVINNPATVPYPGLENLTSSSRINYCRSIVPDQPLQNLSGVYYSRVSTNYMDGLGRPLQIVIKKGHTDGNDIVKPFTYDNLGRAKYQYLPYAAPLSGVNFLVNPGKMKFNVNSQLRGFYDHLGADEQPYAQTEFDNSPLNLVTKQMGAGKSWVGSGKGVKYSYKTSADNRFVFNATFPTYYVSQGNYPRFTIGNVNTDIPQYAGNYENGQLYITTIEDEDGKITDIIKDNAGKIVMKRSVYQKTGPTPALVPADLLPINYAYTFYVYNDFGQLRAVIPPLAIQPTFGNMASSTLGGITTFTYSYTWSSPSVEKVNGLCYTYFYDGEGRVTEKKIPGKDLEYYVYDKKDRQVFYQDGNMRSASPSKWYFSLFDAWDRQTATGITTNSYTRQQLQDLVNQGPSGQVATSLLYYTNNYNLYHVYPGSITNCQFSSFNYYDDYSLGGLNSFPFDNTQFNVSYPPNLAAVPSVLATNTRGLLTGTKVRVFNPDDNTEKWLTTVNYYDSKQRIIQTQTQNFKNGLDKSSNIYFFQGMLFKNILNHRNPDAKQIPDATDPAPITTYTLLNTYTYNLNIDGGNDLMWKHSQKINSGIDYQLAFYDYDHLNRNTTKQLTSGLALQEYNIHGLQNHIAYRNYDNNMQFEENLYYDKGFKSKLFNGNIAGITWAGSDGQKKAYGYSYDLLNRLTHAEFRLYDALNNNEPWNHTEYDYTTSNITYDLNGNLKTMDQRGNVPGDLPFTMDQLTYSHFDNSNRLKAVVDNGLEYPFLPDFKDHSHAAEEYDYDLNGNMKLDANKGITSITYNYLNLPEKITVANKGILTYVYDANGRKLRKTIQPDGGAAEVWDYIGNFVYKNDELQYILNEEGRARPVAAGFDGTPEDPNNSNNHPTKFIYDYFIKDHLGNVRSTVTSNPITYSYLAKHEIVSANIEELVFDNIPGVRDIKPGSTDPNDGMAARLNAAEPDKRIGTAIMLKTKPGDRFQINVNAFFDNSSSVKDNIQSPDVIAALMGALMGGQTYSGVPISELPENQQIIQRVFQNPNLASQLEQITARTDNPQFPKAHLNYLWFNEKMQLDVERSGAIQVSQSSVDGKSAWQILQPQTTGSVLNGTAVSQGSIVFPSGIGTLLIYIDNQSIGKDVWFDNLLVNNYSSSVIEEDHYYPFGLTLQTMPSTNGVAAQPFKYNGKELEKSFDLELLDYGARLHDPQLGIWHSVDPLAEKSRKWSPYSYTLDNPTRYIDPDGMVVVAVTGDPNDTKSIPEFQDLINNGLGGFYKVKTEMDGTAAIMTLEKTDKDASEMTDAQKEFYNAVKGAFDANGKDVVFQLDRGDQQYLIGDIGTKSDQGTVHSLDMTDIEKMKSPEGEEDVVSTAGTLGHEINEAYNFQVLNKNRDESHLSGVDAENKINASERNEKNINGTYANPVTPTGYLDMEYIRKEVKYNVHIEIQKGNVSSVKVEKK